MQEQRLELLEAKQHIKEMESDYRKVLERMDALERVRELKSGERRRGWGRSLNSK